MVSVTGPDVFPDCQVFCHIPACSGIKLSGGSPLENDTFTLPALTVLPQSSRTCDSSATGQAAGTPKDSPSVVRTGTSWVGVHAGLACAWSPNSRSDGVVPAEATIVRKPTRCNVPSENCSVNWALYTPAASALVSGCSTMRDGADVERNPLPGSILNRSLALPATTPDTYD